MARLLGEGKRNSNGARAELGRRYLEATSTAYGAHDESAEAGAAFAERVKNADALLHVQDVAEIDVLSGDAFAEHEGGFFAAAFWYVHFCERV